ncbi:MAG: DNA sulfur modification protein DndD [Fusobacteriaceae bacterium]
MIINSIAIKNYGIYYDNNIFDFSTNDNHENIVLIYGKNGSGKTTLLESIKKVFYGCGTLGLKNPNKVYFDEILKKFNKKALTEGKNEAFVEINFSWDENNETDNYIFKRSWILIKKTETETSVHEVLTILKNGEILDNEKVDFTENYFRTLFPQKLFDFFFFDGEDVKKLISTDFLQNELKESIYTLFNIDIFKSLDLDLSSYIKARKKSLNLMDNEVELLDLEESLKNKNEKIKISKAELDSQLVLIDDLKNKIKAKNERFKNIGGEIYEKKAEIEKNIGELELLRSRDTEYLKTNLLNDLSLHINKDLLIAALTQIKEEEQLKEYQILLNKIEDNSLKSLFAESFNNKVSDEDIEQMKNVIKAKFVKINKIIHNTSTDSIVKITQKLENIENLKELVNTKVENRRTVQNELISLKSKLTKLNENKEFDSIISDIENYQEKLNELTVAKTMLENKLETQNEKLIEISKRFESLKISVIENRKNENKFNVVYKIKNVLDKYVKHKNDEKLESVKTHFISLFNSLHRKKDFIKDVTINTETFEIKLFNEFGEVKNELLSAGEKQVYILCLLGAFLKASNRQIPLIFDTLLGRLDTEHRENIIKNYLPKISKQVLILSTDSEVTSDNYKLLSKHIAKEYSLEYNDEGQYIDIIKKEKENF